MINWAIAGNPVNWIKIGLMACFFLFAFEFLAQAIKPAPSPDTPQ